MAEEQLRKIVCIEDKYYCGFCYHSHKIGNEIKPISYSHQSGVSRHIDKCHPECDIKNHVAELKKRVLEQQETERQRASDIKISKIRIEELPRITLNKDMTLLRTFDDEDNEKETCMLQDTVMQAFVSYLQSNTSGTTAALYDVLQMIYDDRISELMHLVFRTHLHYDLVNDSFLCYNGSYNDRIYCGMTQEQFFNDGITDGGYYGIDRLTDNDLLNVRRCLLKAVIEIVTETFAKNTECACHTNREHCLVNRAKESGSNDALLYWKRRYCITEITPCSYKATMRFDATRMTLYESIESDEMLSREWIISTIFRNEDKYLAKKYESYSNLTPKEKRQRMNADMIQKVKSLFRETTDSDCPIMLLNYLYNNRKEQAAIIKKREKDEAIRKLQEQLALLEQE